MQIFRNIVSAIFGHKADNPISPTGEHTTTQKSSPPLNPIQVPVGNTELQPVDVAAILDEKAKNDGEKLEWRTSIVDLMKLLGIDSSLSARKDLAKELSYEGDTGDSAAMNFWLHKKVLKKLSENGGRVPAELLD